MKGVKGCEHVEVCVRGVKGCLYVGCEGMSVESVGECVRRCECI